MRHGLKTRLAKLENRRNKQGQNRVLVYRAGSPASDFPSPRPGGRQPDPKNATAGRFDPLPGKYMAVCDFGTDEEWADALRAQQLALMAKASSVGTQSTDNGRSSG